jgi:pimeloyl-ACP methyl ester carboxylesterase
VSTLTSRDGTTIALDRAGSGPALILVGGGPTDRSANADLAELLAERFTVFNYDRRGRGDSGDTPPYEVDQEFEDIRAVIDQAGGAALLYGTSIGGIIGLEAAARGLPITRLAVWEPPYSLDGARPPLPADYQAQLAALLAEGRHGDMVELFLTKATLIPAEVVASMRTAPFWPELEANAPGLVRDAAIIGDASIPAERLAMVKAPTLVIDGGTAPWVSGAADKVAAAVPGARRRTLDGQPHNVDSAAIAPALTEFLSG